MRALKKGQAARAAVISGRALVEVLAAERRLREDVGFYGRVERMLQHAAERAHKEAEGARQRLFDMGAGCPERGLERLAAGMRMVTELEEARRLLVEVARRA